MYVPTKRFLEIFQENFFNKSIFGEMPEACATDVSENFSCHIDFS
jgi:hypothetical protein